MTIVGAESLVTGPPKLTLADKHMIVATSTNNGAIRQAPRLYNLQKVRKTTILKDYDGISKYKDDLLPQPVVQLLDFTTKERMECAEKNNEPERESVYYRLTQPNGPLIFVYK